MPAWVAITFCFLLIYLTFITWAQVNFASYRFALLYLRGARLEVRPSVKTIGIHRPGEILDTAVVVRNHGSMPVNVVGAIAECSCIAYRGLPKEIPAGGSARLPIVIRFGAATDEWHQFITFLTDAAQEPEIRFELSGRVEAK
jgi:hypothetical protein